VFDLTPELRYCRGCHQNVPASEVRKSSHYCRECYRLAHAIRKAISYEAELEAQGGVCAICARPPSGKRRLYLDHDHTTGRFRGLLCDRCNRLLGYADDDQRVLAAAIEYLSRPGRKLQLPYIKRKRRYASHVTR
jgi:Recombination endonuclease VII